jgi:hypothetical protein
VKIAPFGIEQWMNEYETRSIEGTDRLRSAVAALYERQGTGNVLIAHGRSEPTTSCTSPWSNPALADGGAKLVVINNPNNPTGSLMDRGFLEQVAAICDKPRRAPLPCSSTTCR